MKWVTRQILSLSQKIEEDPCLLDCTERIFDFANSMGLKGIKLKDLKFNNANKEKDPLKRISYFTCEEEMTDDDYKKMKELVEDIMDKNFKDGKSKNKVGFRCSARKKIEKRP